MIGVGLISNLKLGLSYAFKAIFEVKADCPRVLGIDGQPYVRPSSCGTMLQRSLQQPPPGAIILVPGLNIERCNLQIRTILDRSH